MSSPTPTYSASVSPDLLRYMVKYATGNDGCIYTMTASFQPSGQSVTGCNVNNPSCTGSSFFSQHVGIPPNQSASGYTGSANAGFFFQQVNVPQGVGVNIVFYSVTIPQGTFTITLSFTTTQGNTYQLALINTLPPNADYALVLIVQLTVTAEPAQYVNVQALLQTFTAFASNQCQPQSQPQVSYSGSGFEIIYQYNFTTGTSFGALLLALNTSQLPGAIQVTVTMGGNTVVNVTINTPGFEYAYFLFTVSLVFESG